MAGSAQPAGSISVEVVADLSQLDAGLQRAEARARSSAAAIAGDLAKVETAEKRVGTAAETMAAAHGRAADSTARVATASERAAAQWSRAEEQVAGYQRQMAAAAAVNDNFGRTTEVARHHIVNLGYQLSDVAASLGSGASPFTIMLQQGGQILPILGEIGLRGAIRGVGTAILSFITPAVAVFGTLAAAVAYGYSAWSRYDDEVTRIGTTLQGLGRSTGLTVQGFEALTRSAAAASNMSVRQANDLAVAFAATGKIGPENISRLIGVAKDAAATFGVTMDEVKAKLADAFSSASGIERLNQQLGFLDARTQATITSLFQLGKSQEAIRIAIEALPPALAKSESAQGAVSRAWEAIKNAVSDADMAVGKFLDRLTKGPAPDERLKQLQQRVESLTQAANENLVQPGAVSRTYVPPTSPTVASTVPLPPARPDELKQANDELRRYMEGLAEAKRQEEANATSKALEQSLIDKSNRVIAIRREVGVGTEEDRKYRDMEKALQETLRSGDPALMKRIDNLKDVSEATAILAQRNKSMTNAEGERMTAAERASRQEAVELAGVKARTVEDRARVAQMGAVERQRGQLITAAQAEASAEHAAQLVREQANQQLRDMLRDQQLEADEIRKRIALLGQDAETRAASIARQRAEQDLTRQGISLNSELAQQVLAGAEANARLGVSYDRAAEAQQRMRDGQRQLGFVFTSFVDGLLSGTTKISDAFASLTRSLLSSGLQAILTGEGPLGGLLGTASTERGQVGGILGGQLPNFLRDAVKDGAKAGTEAGAGSGIMSGLSDLFGGKTGPQLLQGAAGIAMIGGSYSIGQQSKGVTGLLGGAASGALGGAMLGAQFGSVGGPLGAAIGAGVGLIGSLLGQSEAKRQREKEIQGKLQELKDQYAAQKASIDLFRSGLRGEATGGVEGAIKQAFAQMIAANKTASQGGDQAAADAMVQEFMQFAARMRAQVRAAMGGTMDEVARGFGTNGPFAQAAAATHQLGEAMRAWLDDVNRAQDAFSDEGLDAIYKGLLATLQPTPEMSGTAKEYQRIQGTAAALQQELVRLNGSAEGAAAAIRDGVTKALDTLRASFNADLDAKINDAQGKGYLNDVVDLLKEVSGLRLDAGLIGGDLGKVDTYFAAAAQKIVNESQLTGEAFSALVTQYPALNGLVREYSAALADQASTLEQVAERIRGYQDRLFAATNDANTEAGALAAFQRQAEQDRAAEVKAGGQGLADLEKAQAAERLNIVRDFAERAAAAEKAIADRRLGYADRLFAATTDTTTLDGQLAAYNRKAEQERQAEIAAGGQAIADLEAAQYAERLKLVTDYQQQAADAEKQRMEAAQQAFDTFARNIKTFVDGLRAGSASPLSPQARLAAAQSQYNAQLTLAQGGDRTALDGITSYASDLLDAAKGFYASSAAFQTIFQQVTGQLTALPSQVSPEQFIVNAIDASKTATVNATQAMQAALKTAIDAGSASATATALLPQFNTLTATTGGLLNYGQFLSATGGLATSSEQQAARAIFNSLDRNNDGQLSKLELINGQVLATAGNTGQTKGAVDTVATLTNNQTALFNEIIRWTAATNTSAANTKAAVDGINAVSEQQKALLGDVSRWTNATFSNTGATNASVQTSNAILGQLQQLNTTNNNQNEVALASARENYATASNTQKLVVNTYNNNLKIGAAATLATGGWVNGPGTATSDSIPAFLSNGEFVVNAASARVYGPLLEAMNENRMSGFSMPAPTALPVPVPFAGGNDNGNVVAMLARILDRLGVMEVNLVAAEWGGAERVREGVDGVRSEQRRANTDATQDRLRPRRSGTHG